MLDDFFSAFRYFRNVDSNSPETTIGKGRKVVRKYAFVIALAVAAGVATGILRSPDAFLLSIYSLSLCIRFIITTEFNTSHRTNCTSCDDSG